MRVFILPDKEGSRMKKFLIVVGCIVAVCAAGLFIFGLKLHAMAKFYKEYSIKNIDFKIIPDGTYRGKCGVFLVAADLEAKVQDHRMSDIKILDQRCGGKKYEGREVIDRVLKEQRLNVDAVAKATASSKCILIALERALTTEGSKPPQR
jgi:uncharacterized protein with FMN-binding domain